MEFWIISYDGIPSENQTHNPLGYMMIFGHLMFLRFWNRRMYMFLILFQSQIHMLWSMTIRSIH